MLSVLDSIIQEFSSFKIEFSTSTPKKGNPFERDIGPGIKINSYLSLNEYDKKCKQFINAVKTEIDAFISVEKNKMSVMLELEEKLILLRTLVQTYMPDDMNLILLGLDIRIPLHYMDVIESGFKEKMTFFVKLSREFINIIVEYIRQKIKLVKKTLKFEVNPQYQIHFPDNSSSNFFKSIKFNYPNMEWARSDTDLIELIISLHELGCIKGHTGEFTQTMAIKVGEDLFNRPLKDFGIKIHKAGARVGKKPSFLEELLGAYSNRLKRLELEKQSNK